MNNNSGHSKYYMSYTDVPVSSPLPPMNSTSGQSQYWKMHTSITPVPQTYQYNNHLEVHNNAQTNSISYVDETIRLIRKLDIKLVAFDFDFTLVRTHTGGQWLDSADKLADYVRPCFRDLLPDLLKSSDLHICVVTFSPQEKLIRDVLRLLLNNEQDKERLINRIIIKGNTKDFIERHGLEASYSSGKQLHLDECRQELLNKYNVAFDDRNILLIDDDQTNITVASTNKHYAFLVPGDRNLELSDLVDYLRKN